MSGETYVFRGEWTDREHWHHGAAPLPWPPVEAFLVALAERFPPSTDIGAVRGLADAWQIDFAADTSSSWSTPRWTSVGTSAP